MWLRVIARRRARSHEMRGGFRPAVKTLILVMECAGIPAHALDTHAIEPLPTRLRLRRTAR